MKKFICLTLALTLLLSVSVFAADFKDMPNNWATEALNAAVNNGLMGGSDGYIYPDNPMTRAEMATIIARATGATKEADLSEFVDVRPGDWFYSSMGKAVDMKAFNGSDGRLNPNNNITRQEAFLVLARVFGIEQNADKEYTELDKFKDGQDVADWAKKGVNMIIKCGYVGGNDGRINPNDNITRAEFAVVMNRLIKYYIDTPGELSIQTDGNTMIRCGNVTINDLVSDKMICVGDIEEGSTVVFNNCDITGSVVLRGGTTNVGGKFTDIKALKKGTVLNIANLSQEVIDTVKIFLDKAKLVVDFAASASN